MKKINLIVLALTLVLAVSCKKDKTAPETEKTFAETAKKVKVKLESKSGSNVTGNVVFYETEDGKVEFHAMVSGLEPGTHAIHIHEKADCSSDDGKSTGGHWNPTGAPHGEWGSSKGFHKGDIGNLEANEKGQAVKILTTDQWCIGCGDKNKDILGKAIIVHEGIDDFTTQPTGDAGGRVSCGGIIE
ncbi:superoxide dismutase family protein [Olleya aquimaris]|uniref:Superoxide dismutase [Cu-Zn] n=1 Tax=Olleya aquimaris TaxID=639310 RepID=A0A327RIH6_9FLAO|nr:superoxide dismutase family protein [Olleya aquimaris]RAJ16856.1 Cu-Zn family superoxide dismutase [Olleya aquimaris]